MEIPYYKKILENKNHQEQLSYFLFDTDWDTWRLYSGNYQDIKDPKTKIITRVYSRPEIYERVEKAKMGMSQSGYDLKRYKGAKRAIEDHLNGANETRIPPGVESLMHINDPEYWRWRTSPETDQKRATADPKIVMPDTMVMKGEKFTIMSMEEKQPEDNCKKK